MNYINKSTILSNKICYYRYVIYTVLNLNMY